jgi:hypothetical protein
MVIRLSYCIFFMFRQNCFIFLLKLLVPDRLEDNGIITECSIRTMETDSLVNFEFDTDKVINKIIMKVS